MCLKGAVAAVDSAALQRSRVVQLSTCLPGKQIHWPGRDHFPSSCACDVRAAAAKGIDRTLIQTIIMVMSRTLPLSEVKAKLSEVVDEVVTTQERVTVTRNGRPVAVVLSTDDLETIEETLAILSDSAAMREIEQGREAIASGDFVTKDEIETLRSHLRSKTA